MIQKREQPHIKAPDNHGGWNKLQQKFSGRAQWFAVIPHARQEQPHRARKQCNCWPKALVNSALEKIQAIMFRGINVGGISYADKNQPSHHRQNESADDRDPANIGNWPQFLHMPLGARGIKRLVSVAKRDGHGGENNGEHPTDKEICGRK